MYKGLRYPVLITACIPGLHLFCSPSRKKKKRFITLEEKRVKRIGIGIIHVLNYISYVGLIRSFLSSLQSH